MVGSLGTMYKHIHGTAHAPSQEARKLTAVPCWCGSITEDGTNATVCAFLTVLFLLHKEKERSYRLRKWKAGSRTLLENSQKNPRTLNTVHKLLPSRTLLCRGCWVSSFLEDGSLSLLRAEWLNTVCLEPGMTIDRE